MFAYVKATCSIVIAQKWGKENMWHAVLNLWHGVICKTSLIWFGTISIITTYKLYYTLFQKHTAFIFRWKYNLHIKLTVLKTQIVQFTCKREIIQTSKIKSIYSPPYKSVMQWNHNFPILELRFTAPKQAVAGVDWVVAIWHYILLQFLYLIACLGAVITGFNKGKLWFYFIAVLSGGLYILKWLG
jgi:hypothetical protein